MPFKVFAAKALAKVAPKALQAVAQIAPKILPQVRTVGALVGKAQGIAGAVSGGASLPEAMMAAVPTQYGGMKMPPGGCRSNDFYVKGHPCYGMGRESINQVAPRPGPVVPGGGRGKISKAPQAPPGGGGGPNMGGGMAGPMTAAGAARKTLTGLFDKAGRWFSDRRVAQLARRVGIELAAAGLGVAVAMVATSIARDATRGVRRRRRGISWGQLNTTRKTLRKFESMNRYLCRPSAAPKRRAAACR